MIGSAAAAWSVVARAQQLPMPVIGFVNVASPQSYSRQLAAFLKGLSETGYVDGHISLPQNPRLPAKPLR